MATTAEKLAEVDAAISKIVSGGQAWSSDNTAITRANLKDLREERAYLEAKLRRESRGSAIGYGVPC